MSTVVLVADRSLSSGWDLLFDGMLAASQTTTAPPWLAAPLLLPSAAVTVAPLGLRRVEAALRRDGFAAADVTVVGEGGLAAAIDAGTRLIGLATGDPLGHGMNTGTMTAVMGGAGWPQTLFQSLLRRVRRLRDRRAPSARILVGGPGAWQLAQDPEARTRLGVDHVVEGYCEGGIAEQVRALVSGREQPAVIAGIAPAADAIPAICGPATFGAVELSRGCGLGCAFCAISRPPMRHLSVAQVLADAETNRAGDRRHLALLSEDALRYGGTLGKPDPSALLALAAELRHLPGAGIAQVDHANLATASRWSDGELMALRRLLALGDEPVWINVGVEHPDGRLVAANGGGAKLGGCPPESWGDLCADQLRRLADAGFLPFASLVLGMPGETPADVARTLAWIEGLAGAAVAVFPMFLAPLGEPWKTAPPSRAHWRVMQAAYRANLRLLPPFVAAQQRAVGQGVSRRAIIQALGLGQGAFWRTMMAWRHWRAAA